MPPVGIIFDESTRVIESWSFGTSRHYDELVRDSRYLLTQTASNRPTGAKFPTGMPQFSAGLPADYMSYVRSGQAPALTECDAGTDFDLARLHTRLINHLNLIRGGQGRVYFNPLLGDAPKTDDSHFDSKWRGQIYFAEP